MKPSFSFPSNHPMGPGLDALQARFAEKFTARLTEQTSTLPQDIGERLRVARLQAIQRARSASLNLSAAETQNAGPMLTLLGWGSRQHSGGWWMKLAYVLPLVALIGGLIAIQSRHGMDEISVAAEIDASLLADDLPPAAYSDPGFLEFLKSSRD